MFVRDSYRLQLRITCIASYQINGEEIGIEGRTTDAAFHLHRLAEAMRDKREPLNSKSHRNVIGNCEHGPIKALTF